MFMRGRSRPSKPMSAMGALMGGAFVIMGVTMAIPMAGAFGILWTLVAAGITVYHAANLFSERGVATHEVEFTSERTGDFESKLRQLERLRADGLLSEAEYQQKRAEILGERW